MSTSSLMFTHATSSTRTQVPTNSRTVEYCTPQVATTVQNVLTKFILRISVQYDGTPAYIPFIPGLDACND